jgi:hypothetical protein
VSFHTQIDPEKWKETTSEDTRRASKLGFSDEIYQELEPEEEFGEDFSRLDYEVETKFNIDDPSLLEGEGEEIEYSEDGTFYNVEIRELVDKEKGKAAKDDIDGGLLAIHFTGYTDENGNNYLVHSDPKRWVSTEEKYEETDQGLPDVQAGLKDTENYFSIEDNYELEDGLREVEKYLSDISERETENLAKRWGGLRDAVAGFRKSLETGRDVSIDRTELNYETRDS